MNKKIYITTPIYYVNDRPHIGHTFTTLLADVYSRYYKLKLGSKNVFFLTGTDEHGLKISQAAEKNGMEPKKYTDIISEEYKDMWKTMNIEYDYFIRTTDPKHELVVQKYIEELYKKGYVYKDTYKGYYCIGCEKYLNDDEMKDGVCPFHANTKLNYQEEENYFFKLSIFQEKILEKLKAKQYEVYPSERYNEVLSRVEQGINDISISRKGIDWGIPLPWDPEHKVYVWVDALLNYYSALQINDNFSFWSPDIQFMAKDILWFHSVIWEGLLLANDIELPKKIFAHGFFTVDGQKMSKTIGNIIDPRKLVDEYGADATRYLLLSSFNPSNDGDISLLRIKERYNADLANGLGNLVSRLSNLCKDIDFGRLNSIKDENKNLSKDVTNELDNFNPYEALKVIWSSINILDKNLAEDKPWLLEGEPKKEILLKYIKGLLSIAENLMAFMPDTAIRITNIFNGANIQKPEPLFIRKV